MKQELEIEIFVLAGGKSSRMGRDKGLVSLNGKPMISYVLETMKQLDMPIKIIANSNTYDNFGFPVIGDVVKEKGPMGGLLTAMEETTANVVFLVSCDMPFVRIEAANALLEAVNEEDIVAPLVRQRVNPLFALYPVHLKESVKNLISEEQLKMTDFILKNRHTLVPSGFRKNSGNFRNINTQQELEEAENEWSNSK